MLMTHEEMLAHFDQTKHVRYDERVSYDVDLRPIRAKTMYACQECADGDLGALREVARWA